FSGLLPGWYDVRAWLTDNEATPPLIQMRWFQDPITTKSEVWIQRSSPTSRVAAQSHQDVPFSAFTPWFRDDDTNLSAVDHFRLSDAAASFRFERFAVDESPLLFNSGDLPPATPGQKQRILPVTLIIEANSKEFTHFQDTIVSPTMYIRREDTPFSNR